MTDTSPREAPAGQFPPDDPARRLATASPDRDESLEHLGVVGDTYTILLSGRDTAAQYTLIDMHVPPGGGPPPHRHDFEECFRVLEGSLEVHVRDLPPVRLEAGESANIPANAPHTFRNPAQVPARLLCTVSPSGLEKYFAEFGDPVPTRTSSAPPLSEAERQERLRRAIARAPEYGMEILSSLGK